MIDDIFMAGKCRNEGFYLMTARTARGFSEKRLAYIYDLVYERLSGKTLMPYISEKQASANLLKRSALTQHCSLHNDTQILEEAPFIDHPSLMVGSQPDVLYTNGCGAFVRPHLIPRHHIAFLRSSDVPDDVMKMIFGFFWVSKAEWCDYVSYCPDLAPQVGLKHKRLWAKNYQKEVLQLANDIESGLVEVDALVQSLAPF